MKLINITKGLSYLEVPEENLRILCGCPENSIKFIMQHGLTPPTNINGMKLVSGPNAILLNDISVLNSHYLNFSEFPVLHQQYFQGAAFNKTDEKFILIGNKKMVDDQYNYIERGLHGLFTKDEILETGVTEDIANKILAIGDYHRGYNKPFDIIIKKYLAGKTEVKGNLFVKRVGVNFFEFYYLDQVIKVDINLESNSKGVGLPYNIVNHLVEFNDFSVTTIGDGNGWNPNVPCMGALITNKKNRYLIDSGPGSLDLIKHLGVTPNEIEGVFVTHSHDDHFAGILSLLNSENRINFFSSSLVIASVQKKFLSLLGITLEELKKHICFIELKVDQWTNIGEMEVMPKYSFHTIETNVFYFRVANSDKVFKTYGHITDIISKKDLDFMIEHNKNGTINSGWAYNWFNNYFDYCDLKRIDAGGGVVHGNSADFIEDKSEKIILSHLNTKADISNSIHFFPPTDFGHTEVLIEASENYPLAIAENIIGSLEKSFGNLAYSFSSEDITLISPGEVVINIKEKTRYTYLVLSGLIEGYSGEYCRKYVKGDFLYSFLENKRNPIKYISNSYSYLLKIDIKSFKKYINSINLPKTFIPLRNLTYFSYGFSFEKQYRFSRSIKRVKISKTHIDEICEFDYFFIESGLLDVKNKNNESLKVLKTGDLSVFNKFKNNIHYNIVGNGYALAFNESDISNFQSILWSIYEELKKIESIVERSIM